MNHEDPNVHLQADDDLWVEHSPNCACSLCWPERLHPMPLFRGPSFNGSFEAWPVEVDS
jgi:hypothetical protein